MNAFSKASGDGVAEYPLLLESRDLAIDNL